MNEEYVKQLMNERKGESPFKLWLEFVGYQLAFGSAIIAVIVIAALVIG